MYRYGTFSDCKLLTDSKNIQILLFEGQFQPLHYMKFSNLSNFDQFQPVTFKVDLQTTKFVHFWNQRAICNQKKYHIDT
jgi:hypothetical protein